MGCGEPVWGEGYVHWDGQGVPLRGRAYTPRQAWETTVSRFCGSRELARGTNLRRGWGPGSVAAPVHESTPRGSKKPAGAEPPPLGLAPTPGQTINCTPDLPATISCLTVTAPGASRAEKGGIPAPVGVGGPGGREGSLSTILASRTALELDSSPISQAMGLMFGEAALSPLLSQGG